MHFRQAVEVPTSLPRGTLFWQNSLNPLSVHGSPRLVPDPSLCYHPTTMEQVRSPTTPPDGPAASFKRSVLWRFLLLVLFAWQGWMTLTLFGSDTPWEPLLDEEPILSGRHPLHLYHGYLGAQSLRSTGSLCCYDPAFQAGY